MESRSPGKGRRRLKVLYQLRRPEEPLTGEIRSGQRSELQLGVAVWGFEKIGSQGDAEVEVGT